jgi:hypothetical protein
VINHDRCAPPLPGGEVRRIADSAARYKPDAKADAFRAGTPAAVPEENAGELPLGQADVEASGPGRHCAE